MATRGADTPAQIAKRFEQAWNTHDMAAFAPLFEEDATFVSRFGHCWRGRDEITDRHAEIHSTIYRDSHISNHLLSLDLLTDDIAVGVVRSLVSVGRFMPDGPRKFSSVFTYVARRNGEGWRIRAGANVAMADPETGELIVERAA
jgi:uncharacterized protein (TIGR02246 family)